jgi:hypothetical protein
MRVHQDAWALGHLLLVSQRADNSAEHEGGSEASNEKMANLADIEAIVLIQTVHVWALQPISRFGAIGGQHRLLQCPH